MQTSTLIAVTLFSLLISSASLAQPETMSGKLDRALQLVETDTLQAIQYLESLEADLGDASYDERVRWLDISMELVYQEVDFEHLERIKFITKNVLPAPDRRTEYWLFFFDVQERMMRSDHTNLVQELQAKESEIAQIGDDYLSGRYYHLLHKVLINANVYDFALDTAIKARKIWINQGNRREATKMLFRVASTKIAFRDFVGAEQDLELSLKEAETWGAYYSLKLIELRQSYLRANLGDFVAAKRILEEILAENIQPEDHSINIWTNVYFAYADFETQQYQKVLDRAAIILSSKKILPAEKDHIKLILAKSHIKLGNLIAAQRFLEEATQGFMERKNQAAMTGAILAQLEIDYAKRDIDKLYESIHSLMQSFANYDDKQGAKRAQRAAKIVSSDEIKEIAENLSKENVAKSNQLSTSLEQIDAKNRHLQILYILLVLIIVITIGLLLALKRIRVLASIDTLTGVANRRKGMQLATQVMKKAAQDKASVAVSIMDLDKFKSINDTYGHATGDRVLQLAVEQASSILRPKDVFCRLGGEEFMLVLPDTNGNDAEQVLERVRKSLEEIDVSELKLPAPISASFGVTMVKNPKTGMLEKMIAEADKALYTAKNNGRNQVVTFN